MVTSLALKRRWRAMLVSDCWVDVPGTFEFKASGGNGCWFVVPDLGFCWTQVWQGCVHGEDESPPMVHWCGCSLCREGFERSCSCVGFLLWAGFWRVLTLNDVQCLISFLLFWIPFLFVLFGWWAVTSMPRLPRGRGGVYFEYSRPWSVNQAGTSIGGKGFGRGA